MIPAWSIDPQAAEDLPLGDLLRVGLKNFPDRIAIADRRQSFTFAELEAAAVAYAALLSSQYGVGPQDRVMVLTSRTVAIVPLIIGLWKLGAVYMPVDSELPLPRLSAIVERARPKLIASFGPPPELPGQVILDFRTVAQDPLSHVAPVVSHVYAPDELVYVIHTSGSTGVPKGVQISEASLKHYFRAHNAMLRFQPESRVFSLTPYHFDVSIEDTILPLSLGAFVFQYNGLPQGDLIRRALKEQRITHLIAVSTLLTIIADRPDAITAEQFPALQMIMTGAEVCAPSVINLSASRLPQARVFNVYGPTEVTIVCTGYQITAPDESRTIAYPIGSPLEGVEILLLDEEDREIREAGIAGELCLGGAQVMVGYLGQPEETARRIFVRDGVRYYRSGDRCFFDSDGQLQFVGRNDAEVKLNGRRINLGEVHAECLAVAGVERAAVGLVQNRQGKPAIGAVVIADGQDVAYRARLRLAERLPAYMLPAVWGVVPHHRLSSTGKTDDRTLLAELELIAASATPGDAILMLETAG